MKDIERVEMSAERVERLLEAAKVALAEEHYRDLEDLVKSFIYVTQLLEKKKMTVRQLRKLLFGLKSEKLQKVIEKLAEGSETELGGEPQAPEGGEGKEAAEAASGNAPSGQELDEKEAAPKAKPKGHGRHGADAYEGAERIYWNHPTLKPGDPCPELGCDGKVYLTVPRRLVRVLGHAPIAAKVIEIEQFRCNLCLKVFTAPFQEDPGTKKFDATAASMMAILRYVTGVPFNRLEGLEKNFKIPLPASTQWDVVEAASKLIAPAYKALIAEAAQGDVLHNDDTSMKILDLMKENAEKKNGKKKGKGDDG